MKIFRRVLIVIGVIILLCIAYVFGLSVYSGFQSDRWLAEPDTSGRTVPVNGSRVFVRIQGAHGPSVIFEGDVGSSSPEWWNIQDRLSDKFVTMSYDRSGYGWSETGKQPRSAEAVSDELSGVIKAAEMKGPFIFVGDGMGAAYVLFYAAAHPDQVAGMVLIEPLSEKYIRFKEELNPVVYKNLFDKMPELKMLSIFGRSGLIRHYRITPYIKPPKNVKDLIVENYSRKASLLTMIDEYRNNPIRSKSFSKIRGKIPPVPVIIIHHSRDAYMKQLVSYYIPYNDVQKIEKIWHDIDVSIAELSPHSRIIEANHSVECIRFTEPDTIIDAVNSLRSR